MAATKSARVLKASQSLAANASLNADEWDVRSLYAGSRATVTITNGSSAPTTAPVVTFYVGEATGKKRRVWVGSGDTAANSVTDTHFTTEQGDMFVNITIQNGATNAITVEVNAQEATGI